MADTKQPISTFEEQSLANISAAGENDLLGGYNNTSNVNVNKKFSLATIGNFILDKFNLSLGGSNQTVKAAIDSLNSNALTRFTIAEITDHEVGETHNIEISPYGGGNIPGEGMYLVMVKTINSGYDAAGIMGVMNQVHLTKLYGDISFTLTRTGYSLGTLSISMPSYTGLTITVIAVKLF